MKTDVKDKNVLVWGMARSGIAAAKLLNDKGAHVYINDLKTEAQLDAEIKILHEGGIVWRLGEKVEDVLDGMDMMIISPGIPAEHSAVALARQKGIEVIGEVELAYRLGKGHLVGVTGTNGKTTTTTLLGEIFKNAKHIVYVVGNIGDPYSAYSAQMKEEDVIVCELSSFQLETIDTFHPEISLILNLTEDHLNRHHTMENYARMKERVFENQTGSDCVILNWDDPITRKMADDVKCRVVWFSRKEKPACGAYVEDETIVYSDENGTVRICRADEVYIPGPHNLENALAAVAAAMCAHVPADVVAETLKTFKGVEHRIETVCTFEGVKYINDSKGTNPDSTIKAVETMKADTVILLGGSEKNSDFSLMCETITKNPISYAVLIGKTGERIGEALKKAGFTNYEYAGYDFENAIAIARAHAVKGGNVLLSPACASFDMFTDYEARGREFKRIVRAMQEKA